MANENEELGDPRAFTHIRVYDDGFGYWCIDACDDEDNYSDACWTHWNQKPLTKEEAIRRVPEFCKEIDRLDLANRFTVYQ